MLGTHYRKPMDWTQEKAAQARLTLTQWYRLIADVEPSANPPDAVVDALKDDLNTHLAILHLRDYQKLDKLADLKAGMLMLGFPDQVGWSESAPHVTGFSADPGVKFHVTEALKNLVERYRAMLIEKNFTAADPIRKAIEGCGLKVNIDKQKNVEVHATTAFDQTALDALKPEALE